MDTLKRPGRNRVGIEHNDIRGPAYRQTTPVRNADTSAVWPLNIWTARSSVSALRSRTQRPSR